MYQLDLHSRAPIYQQLKEKILRLIMAGAIGPGDPLPSVRVMARELGINPNTVQKAYAMLEAGELIRSHTGAKSCISASPKKITEIKDALAEEGGRRAVQTLKAAGYSKAEAIAMIERYWDAEDRRESEK